MSYFTEKDIWKTCRW